jgi:hypothetical protein
MLLEGMDHDESWTGQLDGEGSGYCKKGAAAALEAFVGHFPVTLYENAAESVLTGIYSPRTKLLDSCDQGISDSGFLLVWGLTYSMEIASMQSLVDEAKKRPSL